MSKTKEIDVWVDKRCIDKDIFTFTADKVEWRGGIQAMPDTPYSVKAKLIIEIPEKKITISESEFKTLYTDMIHNGGYTIDYLHFLNKVVDELFK